jgi:hypothetical protein
MHLALRGFGEQRNGNGPHWDLQLEDCPCGSINTLVACPVLVFGYGHEVYTL